jgi:serine/threonine kinase 32
MGNGQGKPVDLNGEGKSTDQTHSYDRSILDPRKSPPLRFGARRQTATVHSPLCTRLRLGATKTLFKSNATNGLFLVNLNHFRLLRVVGRGAFGKVRIVERKDTSLSFALKYIRKDEGMLETNMSS